MLETLAIGFTAGLSAGLLRDAVKWAVRRRKRRAGSQRPQVNILMLDRKHVKELPSLPNSEQWAEYIDGLIEKSRSKE